MGAPRFYIPSLSEGRVRLSEQEADHAVRVRRLSVGDPVALFDGRGREAAARITGTSRKGVEVAVERVSERPRPDPSLTLAVALPKGPRQDMLIEKCCELGVAAIVPLVTERSVSEASEHKLERWRRTAIEAAKQSGQAWIAEFTMPETIVEAAQRIRLYDRAWVAAPGTTRAALPARGRLLGFIGPEGGWTAEEWTRLTHSGCEPLALGPNTLRIETAAIAVAALVHMAQQPT